MTSLIKSSIMITFNVMRHHSNIINALTNTLVALHANFSKMAFVTLCDETLKSKWTMFNV